MRITALAPVRICDCGGWTDTWFAGHGRVLNVAIRPCAEVIIGTHPGGGDRPRVILDVVDYGDRYAPALLPGRWERHPLLEASLARVGLPDGRPVDIRISCGVPAGAATGTSAAVTVALVGALEYLRTGRVDRRAIARMAHEVETVELGQQSGIQDQLCSALGGINDIEMTSYPEAEVRQLTIATSLRQSLERRMVVVILGGGHGSSALHRLVIDRLHGLGPGCADLETLRDCAERAVRAMTDGNLSALGRAMAANTEAQRRLHPELVCDDAETVIEIARTHGAEGWKVNGAGGQGGSLTILGPSSPADGLAMRRTIEAASARFRCLPVALDMDGLRVWAGGRDAEGADKSD